MSINGIHGNIPPQGPEEIPNNPSEDPKQAAQNMLDAFSQDYEVYHKNPNSDTGYVFFHQLSDLSQQMIQLVNNPQVPQNIHKELLDANTNFIHVQQALTHPTLYNIDEQASAFMEKMKSIISELSS